MIDKRPVQAIQSPQDGETEPSRVAIAVGAEMPGKRQINVLLSVYKNGECVYEFSLPALEAQRLAALVSDRSFGRS
jgi:hypothetical protein